MALYHYGKPISEGPATAFRRSMGALMNVFLTGGAGYLGSALISRLTCERDISKVVAMVRNREKASRLATRVEFCDKVEFVFGDLRRYSFDLRDIDVVIHAAAVHDVTWVEENIAKAIEVNVGGTQRLVDAVRRFETQYFIYFSSHSVYMNNNARLVSETSLPTPNIAKAMTKYAGEVLVRSLVKSSTRFVIFRPAHIYGIGVLPRWNDYTLKFGELCRSGKKLTIYGDGNQKVDLVHVRDVCDCTYRFLISPDNVWNESYNVGSGRPISINQLADAYVKATVEMGQNAPAKRYVETRSYTQTRGIRLPCLDVAKLRAKLGWSPSTPIEEGVKEIIAANFSGYDRERTQPA